MMNNVLVKNVDDFMSTLFSYITKQEEANTISQSNNKLYMSHKESLKYLLGKLTGTLNPSHIHTDVLLYMMRKSLDNNEEINSLLAYLYNREIKCYGGFMCTHQTTGRNVYLLQ